MKSLGDPASLENTLQAAVAGDEAAWTEFVRLIAPRIEGMAQSHREMRSRGLSTLVDDVAEILTATLERLSAHNRRNLKRYLAQRDRAEKGRAQSFESWLYGMVDFAVREHLRRRFGRAPKSTGAKSGRVRPSKRDLGTLSDRLDEKAERFLRQTLGLTGKLTIAEIFEHIETNFTPTEAAAMRLYYAEEASFSEIASKLGLKSEAEADKLIRKLNARLRYKYATKSTTEQARRRDHR